MKVIKRSGSEEPVSFDKILFRITKIAEGLSVDPVEVSRTVISGVFDGIKTSQLDELAAETAASMATRHPDYLILGGRIMHSNICKNVYINGGFSRLISELEDQLNPDYVKFLRENIIEEKDLFDEESFYTSHYEYDFFGIKTLANSYLLKAKNKDILETPAMMLLRTAWQVSESQQDIYLNLHLMMEGWFTHATPTLFNSGMKKNQLSSCFLLDMDDDSIPGIFKTLSDCAKISQHSGGIGLSVNKIRAAGSRINGTGGVSSGLVPMLKVFNDAARYVDQSGKRKGSFAVYIEPWHSDVFEFLDLKKNHGKEELRARDLFYAMWIPDIFMRRVKANAHWTLMSPDEARVLENAYGEEFDSIYEELENKGVGRRVSAQSVWIKILESQIETGTPYMLYKDACNRKSNQMNIGVIKSSNLCTEIMEVTSKKFQSVCNLASIALPKFVDRDGNFMFDGLANVTKLIVKNLNLVIDRTLNPTDETSTTNSLTRPIGIGVQGLADVFAMLGYAFDSEQAKALNVEIFKTIYHSALTQSMELAKEYGPYAFYEGSPASDGLLQNDFWGVQDSWFDELKKDIKEYGLRNSLLVAPMPTASTSQILGNNECFEPFTSNIGVRRVLSGEFIVINKWLVRDLEKIGLWTPSVINQIIADNGSVANIPSIPTELKERYKTVWEISNKTIIDLAADRGAYIDQSQSMNLFMADPTVGKLTSMHFYAWEKGLKTGMYYLRSRPKADPIKFTIPIPQKKEEEYAEVIACSLDNPESCVMCGS